mmetsp:Transcript_17163/g.37613  ORF Transcript_17163/g.37613 Transcript_17163/m.37613 type:complete len:234 (-) Transcript_17163:195-896(-)
MKRGQRIATSGPASGCGQAAERVPEPLICLNLAWLHGHRSAFGTLAAWEPILEVGHEAVSCFVVLLTAHSRTDPVEFAEGALHLPHVRVEEPTGFVCCLGKVLLRQLGLQADNVGVITNVDSLHVEHVLEERSILARIGLDAEDAIVRMPVRRHPWLTVLVGDLVVDSVFDGGAELSRDTAYLVILQVSWNRLDEESAISANNLVHLVAAKSAKTRRASDQRAARQYRIRNRE